jgi:hypothetical protein
MRTVNFVGGSSGTYNSYFSTTGWYAEQRSNDYPDDSELNDNLENDSNVLYISSINPNGISGSYYVRLYKGGANHAPGSIITGESGGTCYVRIYKNGSSTVYFNRRSSDNGSSTAKLYNSGGTLDYDWGTQMTGNYKYCTVPGAPASITATRTGLLVNVTYTSSTDDGGDPITGYTVQRATITGGTAGGSDGTVGTWVTHSNSSTLTPGTMYRFRVYATNPAGNGIATYSTNVMVSVYAERSDGTSYVDVVNYQRFDGTNWVPITNFERFDGTTWTSMTDKS